MANLYEILADAQQGEAMAELGSQFGLSPQQTQAAVAALLPAISMGLKQSTATPEGLGALLGVMGRQPDLYAMYDDPDAAFSPEGREAGNAALARMFGSPDASRAITAQAQQLSGVTTSILKKLLPVIAGIIISGLMRSRAGQANPSAPETAPDQGGGLIDILRQIFQQGSPGPTGPTPTGGPAFPPIDDFLKPKRGASESPAPSQPPVARQQPIPIPTDAGPMPTGPDGEAIPGGDLLGHILRELEKGIREGRIKPVVVGPYKIDIPGLGVPESGQTGGPAGSGPAGPAGSGQPQNPVGDILGQILRDVLGGAGGQVQAQVPKQGQAPGLGAAIFGDRIEPGSDVEQSHVDSLQEVLDRFLGTQRR